MFWIGLILILISIILLLVVHDKAKNIHTINTETDKKNEEIEKRNKELEQKKASYLNEIDVCQQNLLNIQEAMRSAGISAEQFYKNLQQSYSSYEYSLDKDYQFVSSKKSCSKEKQTTTSPSRPQLQDILEPVIYRNTVIIL